MAVTIVHTIEQLATLEATLWSILEGMKSNVTYVAFFCREYWGTSASKAQLSLEKLNWSDRLQLQVQQACVLESLSLAVASHFCSGTMQNVSVTIRSKLRNLLYYIHENCLVLLDLLRQRFVFESQNHWSDAEREEANFDNLNFDILVRVNRYRQLRKGEHVMALRQHNEMIANVIRQLCRGATAKQLVPRGRGAGSPGDRSPGIGGSRVGRGSASGGQNGVLSAVNDLLASSTPLDRMRPRTVRTQMLQYMRFHPLLNDNSSDPDCPWPDKDPYERFGAERFATDGPIIWFEPLPPMMTDRERIPKLPPPGKSDVWTLVLDLDETLVHYFELNGMGNYGIRPGMFDFLQRTNELGYELVIFTAATQDYADWVIDQIDPDRLVHHRLYRQHALPWGPLFVKDLKHLGRDLDRTLIIDNVQENFMLQPNNGIFISTWYDDPQDCALLELTPLLEELIKSRARVPDILHKYRDQIPTWAGFGQYWELQDSGLDAPPDTALEAPQYNGIGNAPATRQLGLYGTDTGVTDAAQAYSPSAAAAQYSPYPEDASNSTSAQQALDPPRGIRGGTSPSNDRLGYPQQQEQQLQPQLPTAPAAQYQPRTAAATAKGAAMTRPMASYGGISGPYQAAPPVQTRPAFSASGIAGPYQAPLPARHR